MRKLTVNRKKKFTGSLMKVKLAISDKYGDIEINGKMYTLLDKIKNNQTLTFEITNEPCTLVGYYDVLSFNMSGDSFQIPAGEEDILITGECTLSPLSGNPFVFNK